MGRMTDELPPDLRAALQALDAQATARAARVDPDAVAARVLERLRREGRPRLWRVLAMPPVVLRIAAAVVVLAAGVAVVSVMRERPQQSAMRLPMAIPAVDSLDAGQLEAVLEAAGEVRPVVDTAVPLVSSASLDDLSEQQLQMLLASLKGGEG